MERAKKLTKTELKLRGWTDKMMSTLLPEPELKRNHLYHSSAPMKLWKEEDVLAAEQTPEFTEMFKKISASREKRTANNKAKDEQYKKDAEEKLKKWQEDWAKLDEESNVMLNLAFWTMWISVYADIYHNAFRFVHPENKGFYYTKKNAAISVLMNSKLTKIKYFTNLTAEDEKYNHYIFEISANDDSVKFIFWIPYPVAMHQLGFADEKFRKKYKIQHIEALTMEPADYLENETCRPEGAYRIGLEYTAKDRLFYTESFVEESFDKAFKNAEKYMSDPFVTDKKGVFEYILNGEKDDVEKALEKYYNDFKKTGQV